MQKKSTSWDEYFLNFLALPALRKFCLAKCERVFPTAAAAAAAAFPFVTTDKTPTLKYYASVLMHSTQDWQQDPGRGRGLKSDRLISCKSSPNSRLGLGAGIGIGFALRARTFEHSHTACVARPKKNKQTEATLESARVLNTLHTLQIFSKHLNAFKY